MEWTKEFELVNDDGEEIYVELAGDGENYWEFTDPDDEAKVIAHLDIDTAGGSKATAFRINKIIDDLLQDYED